MDTHHHPSPAAGIRLPSAPGAEPRRRKRTREPPAARRPQLPPSLKQGVVAQIDWPLTVLVALSFLLHFGLVGGMYSDWMDPVVDTELDAQLALVPSPPEPPRIETETQDEAAASASARASEPRETVPTRTRAPGTHPAPTPATAAANDPAMLLREWEQMSVVAIGTMDQSPNLRRVLLAGDEGPPIDLNAFGRNSGGIDEHTLALNLPRAGEPLRPGSLDEGLQGLRHGETGPVASTAGTVRPVVPFTLRQDPPGTTGCVPDLESVIRSQLQPRARQCFQRAVTADPSLPDGSLFVSMQVGASGEVSSAGVTRTGLSEQVASCVAGAARRLVFHVQGAAGATVTVPMHFVKQR
jgi:hypothetical protein